MDRTLAINGLDMFVRDSGTGEPLLLLHGFTGSGDDWSLVFPEPLSGYRAIAPDMRGHGRSTNPSRTFTFVEVAKDILALLDHLGLDRVKAIGMSGGANTLLHIATRHPGRIEAMMHVSGTPRFPEQTRAIMRTMTEESRSAKDWADMRSRHHLGDDQIRELWRHSREFAESYDDVDFTPESLSTITARTMIVHGDRDELYPVDLAVELYRGIPGSSLWVVPEGGHGPMFGVHNPPFVYAAANFLKA
jgi:pimeloyl-ACP methyl ester carboxylesterase